MRLPEESDVEILPEGSNVESRLKKYGVDIDKTKEIIRATITQYHGYLEIAASALSQAGQFEAISLLLDLYEGGWQSGAFFIAFAEGFKKGGYFKNEESMVKTFACLWESLRPEGSCSLFSYRLAKQVIKEVEYNPLNAWSEAQEIHKIMEEKKLSFEEAQKIHKETPGEDQKPNFEGRGEPVTNGQLPLFKPGRALIFGDQDCQDTARHQELPYIPSLQP